MKRFRTIHIAAVMIISIMAFALTANAQDNSTTKVAKIKTTVTNKESINRIELITNLLKGVAESKYDSDAKLLTVKYNPVEINPDMLAIVVENLGYKAEVTEDNSKDESSSRQSSEK